MIDRLTDNGQVMASFIALISSDAIPVYDFVLHDRHMGKIAQQTDVIYGVIVSPKEVVLSSYINNQHQSMLYNPNKAVSSILDIVESLNGRDDILPLNFKITNAGETIDYVRIGSSTLQADKLSRRILREHMIEILIIIVFLSLSIYYQYRKSAISPIQDLIVSSENLPQGQALHRTPINSNDELGNSVSIMRLLTPQAAL